MPESFGTVAGRSIEKDRTDIARRMVTVADAARADVGDMEIDNTVNTNQRWTIDERWVTFECGCVAERCMFLFGERPFDPVIFRKLPQQAVYEKVCQFHGPSMNFRLGMGGFKTFDQWKKWRRALLMGRAK